MAGLLVITALLLPWLPPFVANYVEYSAWQQAPLSPIGGLPISGVVKVTGVIVSNNSVALGGHEAEQSCGRGCSTPVWVFNSTDQFYVRDATGSILVAMTRYWFVADGPHPCPWATDVAGTLYFPGDTVYVYGSVEESSTGVHYLRAQIVSPNPSNPAPSLAEVVGVTVVELVLAGLWVRFEIPLHRKKVLHRKALAGRSPTVPDPAADVMDPQIIWRSNREPIAPIYKVAIVAAIGLAIGLVLLLPFATGTAHTVSDFVSFSLASMLVLLVAGAGEKWIVYAPSVPSGVGFSDRGLHRWYRSPYDRKLNSLLIPWDSVQTLERAKGRGSRNPFLFLMSGEQVPLNVLTPENLGALQRAVDEQRVRRPR